MKKGIILAYVLNHEVGMNIRKDDLVQITDGYDNNYYSVVDVKKDKHFPYFLKSRANGELMNYCRAELIKCYYAFFDYDEYTDNGNKVMLGHIMNEDLEYIKAKRLNDLELGWSEIDNILSEDLIGLTFKGDIGYLNDNPETFLVFKVNKPELVDSLC